VTSEGLAAANIVAYDIDGDGARDLIACGQGAPFAVSALSGTYAIKWHGPRFGCEGLAVGDLDGDGGVHVITASGTSFRVYDPRSLAAPVQTVSLSGGYNAADLAVGNVDDDATPEIIVVTNGATHVYDGLTLQPQWTATGYGGDSVRIGDVDGDSRREVIVSGSTGYVLDAAAQIQKWGYVGGFSYAWDVGNVDADAKDEIVFYGGSGSYPVTILNGDTFAVSTWNASESFSDLAIADGNGDGVPEVILSPANYGSIRGLAPAGGTPVWSILLNGSSAAVGVAELDGDSAPEVFWAADSYYSTSGLYIGTAGNNLPDWRSPNVRGWYHSAVADLDGDGTLEHIVGTTGSGSSDLGTIEIFDVATGVSEGMLPIPSTYSSNVGELAVGQLDADPALEVAALIGTYEFRLMTWDGASRQVEFNGTTQTYRNNGDGLQIANIDGDAVHEIFVASGSQLLVLNGASNIIQRTLPIGSDLNDFALADLNGDETIDLIVAAAGTATVYDTQTWGVLGSAATGTVVDIEATSGGGGTVALRTYYDARIFILHGPTLTPGWECSSSGAMVFAEIDGETWLVGSDSLSLRLYPISGGSCPDPESVPFGGSIIEMKTADMNGDGRNELLIDAQYSHVVALLGHSGELRGDVDDDEVISVDDVDATADYLFGTATAMRPAGDANADGRIGVEDVFTLINYEFAGGAAPQP
jgi:hypothetical protein